MGKALALGEKAETDVVWRDAGQKVRIKRDVGRADRANVVARGAGIDPLFPAVGIRPYRQRRIGANLVDASGVDLDAGVERDRAGGVRQKRVDVDRHDAGEIDNQLRQALERRRNRLAIGRLAVAIARQEATDAGALDQIAGKHAVERRQRDRGVVHHLDGDAAGTEQDDRPEDRIVAHAQNQFLRMFAHHHRLDGIALDIGLRRVLANPALDLGGRRAGRLGRAQIEHDAADIRFVRDRLRQQLHHHVFVVLQKPGGRLAGLGRRSRHDRLRHGDAVGGDDGLGFRLGQHAPPLPGHRGEHGPDFIAIFFDILAAARRHAHQRALGARPVAEIGNRGGGGGRRLEAGKSGFLQDAAALAGRVIAEPAGQNRLAVDHVSGRQAGNRAGGLDRRGQAGRTVEHHDRIDARIGGDRRDGSAVTLGRGVADNVDRVGVRPGLRQGGVQSLDGCVRQYGQFAPAVDELIDGQHPGATAIGDDGDPRAFERGKTGSGLGSVEKFGKAFHAQDAGPLQRGVGHPVGARQRAGMGGGRLGRGFVAARLDGDHRLEARGRARRRHELARIGDRLEIHHDRACARVAGQHVEPVADIHIGHVAQRDDVGKTEMVFRRPVYQRGRDRARLRQKRDIAGPGRHMRKSGIEPGRRDHQPERVRPDDAEEIRAGRLEHGLAQAVFVRQPRGDDHSGARAPGTEIANDAGHGRRRRGDDAKVGNAGQIGDAGITTPPGDLVIFRIDRPDLALKTGVDDVLHHHPANRPFADRGAEDRKRFGMNGVLKIADGHCDAPWPWAMRADCTTHARRVSAHTASRLPARE